MQLNTLTKVSIIGLFISSTFFGMGYSNSNDSPIESYQVAQKYLDSMIEYQDARKHYLINSMKLNDISKINEAVLGRAINLYIINYKDLDEVSDNGITLLQSSTLAYVEYPIMIDDVIHGMIRVEQVGDEWRFNSLSGKEASYSTAHRLRTNYNNISFLHIDRTYRYIVMTHNGEVLITPQNKNSAELLNLYKDDNNQYPVISFNQAHEALKNYIQIRINTN